MGSDYFFTLLEEEERLALAREEPALRLTEREEEVRELTVLLEGVRVAVDRGLTELREGAREEEDRELTVLLDGVRDAGCRTVRAGVERLTVVREEIELRLGVDDCVREEDRRGATDRVELDRELTVLLEDGSLDGLEEVTRRVELREGAVLRRPPEEADEEEGENLLMTLLDVLFVRLAVALFFTGVDFEVLRLDVLLTDERVAAVAERLDGAYFLTA